MVIDSSVLIDVLRRRPEARTFLRQALDGGLLHGSVVAKAEVLSGMFPREADETRGLLEVVTWHDVTDDLAEEAGRLGQAYRKSHGVLGVSDLLIAATAKQLDLPLATRNVKHFPMFPDLRPPY